MNLPAILSERTGHRVPASSNGGSRSPARVGSSTRRPTSAPGRPDPPAPNLLDKVLAWFSPERAARRMAARFRIHALRDFFDGATLGRRGASIRRSLADANAVTEATLARLRAGSRDLVRNNPHARRGVEVLVSNVIGTGIAPQFVRNGRRAEDLERLADAHLETTEIDADGLHTYHGLQAIAFQTLVESGEVLIRRRARRLTDGLAVPIQFQVLEPDFLDESRDRSLPNGGKIIQGVEFDALGRRRGYWLFRNHPGSATTFRSESQFVPASSVLHVYRVDRPGQVRGVPWLAPVMLRLADFADYEDAQLVRQKIAACFAGFIKETFASGFPSSVEQDGDDLIDTLEPGILERLPPGTEVEFAKPPEVDGYEEYVRVSLRAIAAGLGVSYTALTGDLTGVNFSSGKMGHIEFQRNIDRWQSQIIEPQLCTPLMRWWLDAAVLVDANVADVRVRHVPPRREMIDPTKEVPAERDAIRSGQKTLTQVIRASGRDPREHLEELARDMEALDELGLVLDSDPRRTSRTGRSASPGENGSRERETSREESPSREEEEETAREAG